MEKLKLLTERMDKLMGKIEDKALGNELRILLKDFQLETEKYIKEVIRQCKNKGQAQK